MSVIKFGTDGWRGVIAREFTFANVAFVAQAIAMYVRSKGQADQGIVIGYDNRFLGSLFAERIAEVLAGNGIPVLLSDAPAPTPAIASAIVDRQLAGAVMVTASHNPPEYNGIKFIPDYAGPATPEITDAITRYVREVEAEQVDVKVIPYARAVRDGLVTLDSPRQSYGERLKDVVDRQAIAESSLKVVLDPMYGAGIGYLEEILQELDVDVVDVLHNRPDPMFGGDLPEPCEEKLWALSHMTRETGAHLGLALDGDADRFGVIDPSGKYVTPNEVFVLLTHYFIKHRGPVTKVARTVATTHLIDRIAWAHNIVVKETPVGFKYIGEEIRGGAAIGGEESGGLSIAAHIPEKDGLLVGLLMLELIAKTGKTPLQLLAELGEEYGTVVNERVDCHMSHEQKENVLSTMRGWDAPYVGDWKVVEKTLIDGVKIVVEPNAWFLVRPSGTEPLVRIYFEARSKAELHALKEKVLDILGLTVSV